MVRLLPLHLTGMGESATLQLVLLQDVFCVQYLTVFFMSWVLGGRVVLLSCYLGVAACRKGKRVYQPCLRLPCQALMCILNQSK